MTKVTYGEAVKKLSEANQAYKIRLEALEKKLPDVTQDIEKNKGSENTS
jgi:hypothetical protein